MSAPKKTKIGRKRTKSSGSRQPKPLNCFLLETTSTLCVTTSSVLRSCHTDCSESSSVCCLSRRVLIALNCLFAVFSAFCVNFCKSLAFTSSFFIKLDSSFELANSSLNAFSSFVTATISSFALALAIAFAAVSRRFISTLVKVLCGGRRGRGGGGGGGGA